MSYGIQYWYYLFMLSELFRHVLIADLVPTIKQGYSVLASMN